MLPSGSPVEPASAEFGERIAAAGRTFGDAGVVAVYLVHGTFAGNDILGLLTELARYARGLSEALRKVGKGALDAVIGETGNYTAEYAAHLEEHLSAGAKRSIAVRRFNWSSHNNHVGRADGAVRLIGELADFAAKMPAYQLESNPPPRVQLWGHSHGGNALALATNLLAGIAEDRRAFFHAARTFYRRWFSGNIDVPEWPAVEALLFDADHPLRKLRLDWVNFGTPVRYGWEPAACDKLLHVTNHQPVVPGADWLAAYPPDVLRVLTAPNGDFVQQIGIAGTNLPPNPITLRTFLADWRLRGVVERDLKRQWLRTRLKRGVRVPNAGTTLLVDYDDPETLVVRHLAGHACYTRSRWAPLHCELVAKEFYGGAP